jgi:hypothetical protein
MFNRRLTLIIKVDFLQMRLQPEAVTGKIPSHCEAIIPDLHDAGWFIREHRFKLGDGRLVDRLRATAERETGITSSIYDKTAARSLEIGKPGAGLMFC